ncbi:hypothetical protein ACHAWF_004823, partial [Thalassiosira exigua]
LLPLLRWCCGNRNRKLLGKCIEEGVTSAGCRTMKNLALVLVLAGGRAAALLAPRSPPPAGRSSGSAATSRAFPPSTSTTTATTAVRREASSALSGLRREGFSSRSSAATIGLRPPMVSAGSASSHDHDGRANDGRNPLRRAREWARGQRAKVARGTPSKEKGRRAAGASRRSIMSRDKRAVVVPRAASRSASASRRSGRPRLPYGLLGAFITLLLSQVAPRLPFLPGFLLPPAWAGGGAIRRDPDAVITPLAPNELAGKLTIWLAIFTALALLHAAEIAITTLYPWKVREFAEEEEKQAAASGGGGRRRRGTFQALNEDITRVLTTILVASTACSIYATTLFTHLADHIFGTYAEKWSAVFLTAITLFFVELLPKNIGVINAERVARFMVPPINFLANIVGPAGYSLSYLAQATLRLFGIKKNDSSGVSDSELRLIVTGARDSGTIDHSEQEMIKGVLNLQDQKVREIMKPRVEVVAVPRSMSVASVLGVVRESGYSRIPVYEGEIDNIVGIVLAKSVLDFFVKGVLVEDYRRPSGREESAEAGDAGDERGASVEQQQQRSEDVLGKLSFLDPPTGKTVDRYVRSLTGTQLASRMETTIDDAGLIESCYFVPDTANGWSVLQEMRRRRVHMAVVVDEYGGTEGLVSLEDIVEEVSFRWAEGAFRICADSGRGETVRRREFICQDFGRSECLLGVCMHGPLKQV